MPTKEPKAKKSNAKPKDQYGEGQEAFRLGFAREQNPYSPGGHNFADWDVGWAEAKEEDKDA